jgi:hypothetical protein
MDAEEARRLSEANAHKNAPKILVAIYEEMKRRKLQDVVDDMQSQVQPRLKSQVEQSIQEAAEKSETYVKFRASVDGCLRSGRNSVEIKAMLLAANAVVDELRRDGFRARLDSGPVTERAVVGSTMSNNARYGDIIVGHKVEIAVSWGAS